MTNKKGFRWARRLGESLSISQLHKKRMEKKREGKNAFVVQPPVFTKFWTESWLGNCIVSEQITDFLTVVFEAMLFRLVFEPTLISSIQESSF